MKRPYRLLRYARRDLSEIAQFIGRDNPEAASRVISSILTTIQSLTDGERIGHPLFNLPGNLSYLKADRPAQNYFVIYRASKTALTIIGIVHGGRDWTAVLGKR